MLYTPREKDIVPTRRNFYTSVLSGFALSLLIMVISESKDGYIFGVWIFVGTIIFSGTGMLIIFGTDFRDSIFGFTVCPHCKADGWDIKQKLKITKKERYNFGECSCCGGKGEISYLHIIPLVAIIFSWLPILIWSHSFSITFAITYILGIGYFFYFARYVPIYPYQHKK